MASDLVVMFKNEGNRMQDIGSIPSGSVMAAQSKNYDYIDSFSMPLKRQDVKSWELIPAFFLSAPNWVDNLMVLRNKIVSIFGLKAEMTDITKLNPPFSKGQKFGVFCIHEITENEVVLGENDKHLDFRTSLFIENGTERKLVVSTAVKVNNLLGATYFFVVKRVHRIIVPIMLKRMIKNIDEKLLPHYEQSQT